MLEGCPQGTKSFLHEQQKHGRYIAHPPKGSVVSWTDACNWAKGNQRNIHIPNYRHWKKDDRSAHPNQPPGRP